MRILNDFWSAERERWFLWIPVGFGIGIGTYFGVSTEPPIWTGAVLTIAAALLAWGSARFVPERRLPVAILVFVAIAGLGFAAAGWRCQSVARPVLQKRLGPVGVTGRVAVLETYANGVRVTLAEPRVSSVAPHLTPGRVRVRLRGRQPDVLPGDWLRLRAILNPPSPPALPGGFDFQRQAYFQSVGAVGFSLGPAEITARAAETGVFSPANAVARMRATLTRKITEALPGTPGAVATALITGERRAIPDAVIAAMRDSGLAHLLAISGLHIGLVAGLLFGAVRALGALVPALVLRHPIKKWAAVVALIGAFAYALIAGATLPTQRAFLMVGIALLGVLLDRRGLSLRSVAWAAMAVLTLQPESLLSASFQMSFAAVTALVAVYEGYLARRLFADGAPRNATRRWSRRLVLYVAGVALTTLVAGAATAPFAVYHFNRVADFGVIANLLAVPLTALWIMPWAIVAMAALPFGLAFLGLVPMGWGIELMVRIAETVASWPGAVTLVPAMPTGGLALAALGGLWLAIWRSRARYAGLVAVVAGLLPAAFLTPPDILVDGGGRVVALRTASGDLLVSNLRAGRFEREIWARHLAIATQPRAWPATGRAAEAGLNCDVSGCLFSLHGKTVALPRHERALTEDCWAADAVIATVPVRGLCPAPMVIDWFGLWREGGHAVWLAGAHPRVETVNGRRGHRPWVLRPPPRRRDIGS